MTVRRVAVLTGTRADYGLLKHLAKAIEADERTELQLIVSGTHVAAEHGTTVDEITADGLPIAAVVPIWSGDDNPVATATDTGSAVAAYATTLSELDPDVVVVLGDRLEALAMALAATILGVPVAHIHGGEITEGAMDDALRHAITKLSFLHLATTTEHRQRVIQLGEDPARVHNLGAPVLDAIAELDFLDVDELGLRFGIRVDRRTVLLTFHPAAFDASPSITVLRELLAALDQVPDIQVIVTGTNSDIGSTEIRAALAAYVESRDGVHYVESFGQLAYLSAMRLAGVVTGNSSSTVLEAPLVGTPSVLVGDRQQGRPLSATVLAPEPTSAAIAAALTEALSPSFREDHSDAPSVFGTAGFAARALEVLASAPLSRSPRKSFTDLTKRVPS